MKTLLGVILGVFVVGLMITIPSSFADTETTVTPLSDELSLEKTVTTMVVPEGNTLPWGTVRGTVDNPAERYPVIIQFFKGEEPVHVAQVKVKGDDSFEYKFRVRNVVDGQAIDIFEGQYTVKIFKVIQN